MAPKGENLQENLKGVLPEKDAERVSQQYNAVMDLINKKLLENPRDAEALKTKERLQELRLDVEKKRSIAAAQYLAEQLDELSRTPEYRAEDTMEKGPFKTAKEITDAAKNLERDKSFLSPEEFNDELGKIIQSVLANVESNPKEIPADPKVYKFLTDSFTKTLDGMDPEIKAGGKQFLAELYSLSEKSTRASGYKVGGKFRRVTEYATRLANSDENAMTVSEVDIIQQKVKFKEQAKWYTFQELESGEFLSLDRDQTVPKHENLYGDKIEELMISSSKEVMLTQIKDLNKEIKLAHVSELPEYSILKRLNGKYFNIDDKGDVKIEENISMETLREVYKALIKQFEIEKIAKVQEALDKDLKDPEKSDRDPYIAAKIIILDAHKLVLAGETDKAYPLLEMFIKKVVAIKKEKNVQEDQEIAEGLKYAIIVLKNRSLEALGKLSFVAKTLFYKDEDDRRKYFNPISDALKKEHQRISETETAIFVKTDNLPSVPEDSQKGALWNKVLSLETSKNLSALADDDVRKQEYKDIADSFRGENVEHDEVAKLYYKSALKGEMAAEEALVADKKAALEKKYKVESYSYQSKAKAMIVDMLENDPDSLRNMLVGTKAGTVEITPENFETAKGQLLANPDLINKLAAMLVKSKINAEVDNMVFEKLEGREKNGSLKGLDLELSKSLTNMEGIGSDLSDETMRFLTRELVIQAIVVLVSATVGMAFEGAADLALISRSTRLARMAENGSIAIDLARFGARTAGFTVGMNVMDPLLHGNKITFKNFGKDFAMNALMFMSIEAGSFAWSRMAGDKLVGKTIGQKVLFNSFLDKSFNPTYAFASRGAKALDYAGKLATETGTFTGLGVAERMVLNHDDWSDIDPWTEVGRNFVTIMALRAGGRVAKPVMEPLHKGITDKHRMALEDKNPDLFVRNIGVTDYIPATDTPAAKAAAIQEYRVFTQRFNLNPDFFEGRPAAEVRRIMGEVNRISALTTELTEAELLTLATTEPVVMHILSSSKTDVLAIRGLTPNLEFRSTPGIERNAATNEFSVTSGKNLVDALDALNKNGFKISVRDGEFVAEKGKYTGLVRLSPAARAELAAFSTSIKRSYETFENLKKAGRVTPEMLAVAGVESADMIKRGENMGVLKDGNIVKMGSYGFMGLLGLDQFGKFVGGNSIGVFQTVVAAASLVGFGYAHYKYRAIPGIEQRDVNIRSNKEAFTEVREMFNMNYQWYHGAMPLWFRRWFGLGTAAPTNLSTRYARVDASVDPNIASMRGRLINGLFVDMNTFCSDTLRFSMERNRANGTRVMTAMRELRSNMGDLETALAATPPDPAVVNAALTRINGNVTALGTIDNYRFSREWSAQFWGKLRWVALTAAGYSLLKANGNFISWDNAGVESTEDDKDEKADKALEKAEKVEELAKQSKALSAEARRIAGLGNNAADVAEKSVDEKELREAYEATREAANDVALIVKDVEKLREEILFQEQDIIKKAERAGYKPGATWDNFWSERYSKIKKALAIVDSATVSARSSLEAANLAKQKAFDAMERAGQAVEKEEGIPPMPKPGPKPTERINPYPRPEPEPAAPSSDEVIGNHRKL